MREQPTQTTIAIAATFTAEPVEDSLKFWMPTIGLDYTIKFAPYNQIFQQLLVPNSIFNQNHQGINIILLGLDDWMIHHQSEKLLINVENLSIALQSAREHNATPYLICFTPASPQLMADPEVALNIKKMEALMADKVTNISGVYFISSSEFSKKYPVNNYYNESGKELGHISYHPTLFTALGTMLARKISAIIHPLYKVIVLDCDYTLWNGVVGEEGPLGIEIDAPRKALQEFLVAQYEAGMLLCLCSKNNEQDVLEVFQRRPEMPLKQKHLVDWRINWHPKSENIKSLAEELQLGLNSFIFIDDNPVECAEVQAHCPEVLTLPLPEKSKNIPRFLNQIWAFDHLNVTNEDQQRTELYRQNIEREKFKHTALDLADFIAGLDLKVEISELTGKQITRVSQLTQRTNQFNFSTIRRSESEIQNLWISKQWECLTVTVSDRFGDYGLVGAMIFQQTTQAIKVDTFLLSCRVLGRGVEHKMLAKLAKIGESRGVKLVEVSYVPTQKNQPALTFLNNYGAKFKRPQGHGFVYKFPIKTITNFSGFAKQVSQANPSSSSKQRSESTASIKVPEKILSKIEQQLTISRQLYGPEKLLEVINSQKPKKQRPNLSNTYEPPSTKLQTILADLFADILNIQPIGIYDDFFELGGDSLEAALLLNKLGDRLGKIMYAVALLDAPTIDLLCGYLKKNYPEAIANRLGIDVVNQSVVLDNSVQASFLTIDSTRLNQFRELIAPLPEIKKNPSAIFILSPPRAGSTLLRVMLSGHSSLFAPPELHLMSFNNLAERKSSLEKFWSQGIIQAIKELKDISTEAAEEYFQTLEELNLPTQSFYQRLQEWAGDRRLVDKTPLYALDLATLQRIESYFENPLYIHLVRHPYGMIRSFEEIKLDLVLNKFNCEQFSRKNLAELFWLTCNQNILDFSASIPSSRICKINYENLVKSPQGSLEKLCEFLGIDFEPNMLDPYKNQRSRMTVDQYGHSRILGDLKFNNYQRIESGNAEKWLGAYTHDFLGDITWEVAARLGYDRSISNSGTHSPRHQQSPLVKINSRGEELPIFFIHPIGGGVFCYHELANQLGLDRPFYGLQAAGFNGEQEPLTSIEAMAAYYIDAISEVQTEGPYLLGGWSLGGAIAFEMAHQLLQKKQKVGLLCLIDTLAPIVGEMETDETTVMIRFSYNLAKQAGKDLQLSYSYLEQFDIDEQLYRIWEQAKSTGAIDRDMPLRQFRYLAKLYRANVNALEKYHPKVYPKEMILWRASQHFRQDYAAGGWDSLVSGNLQVHNISGDHYTIMQNPQLTVLSKQLKSYLTRFTHQLQQ